MKAVILAGGRGMRLRELGENCPKPLVEVGGRPIVEHLIDLLAFQGVDHFVLALGHGAARFHQWAADSPALPMRWPARQIWRNWRGRGVALELIDTGENTDTGGRLFGVRDAVSDGTFVLTYGDGLADWNLEEALAQHRAHGRWVTVTSIQPRTTLGVMDIDATGRVREFKEKPVLDVWVNGGFIVCEPAVVTRVEPRSNFEKDVMPMLAAEGQLMAYRHRGFWACMDTPKDHAELDALARSSQPPWAVAQPLQLTVSS